MLYIARTILLLSLLFVPLLGWSQSTYSVLIDSDNAAATGCTVDLPASGQSVAGIELRLDAVVDGEPVQIQSASSAMCNAGTFAAAQALSGNFPYPLGLGNNFEQALELAVSRELIGVPDGTAIRLTFLSATEGSSDLVASRNGQPEGEPIVLELGAETIIPIPLLNGWGAVLLGLILVALAWRQQQRLGRLSSYSGLLLLGVVVSGVLIAAHFNADGNLGDWDGQAPCATDPSGDGEPDLIQIFCAEEGGFLFFRMDSAPPVPVFTSIPQTSAVVETLYSYAITTTGPGNASRAITALTLPAWLTLSDNGDGSATLSGVPAESDIGEHPVMLQVQVGNSPVLVATQSFNITVSAANNTPSADAQNVTVLEDAALATIALTGNDPDGDPLSFSIDNPPSNGSLGPMNVLDATSASIDYTPNADYNGPDSFTFLVNDGTEDSTSATVSIAVQPVNDAPSFTVGPDQTAAEDAGGQTVPNWASNISAGPADEAGQALMFQITGNDNLALFSTAPTVSADGTLSYTPAPNANGFANITLMLVDDGGTDNGGEDTSASSTFSITIGAADDPPTAVDDSATVAEDDPATTINVLANDTDIDGGLISIQSVTQPANGTVTHNGSDLTYLPNADYCNDGSPTDNFTYTLTPGGSSATVSVTVTCVNDAPIVDLDGTADDPGGDIDFAASFTEGGGPIAIVDITELTVSDIDSSNLVSATITLTNLLDTGLETLAVDPATIDPNTSIVAVYDDTTTAGVGVLNLSGSATLAEYQAALRSVIYNNGSAAPNVSDRIVEFLVNDGAADSLLAISTITITGINDAPSFAVGPDQTVLEDAGAQTVNGWATAIDDGDGGTQTLTFNVTGNTNPTLFSAGPSVDASGALTYTPAADANGSATVTLELQDDGGTANGGVDTSAPQSFTVTVTAVNDAPSFSAGPDQTVNEDAGPQTVDPWATALSAGPTDEAGQTLSFNITDNSNPGLFSAGPTISATGVLSYTPTANASGSATITITLQDDGGTANGGVDTSAPQSFIITVNAFNTAPSFSAGPDQTVLEDAGAQTVNGWATAIDDGDGDTQTLTFNVTGNTNPTLFSAGPSVDASGALTYTPAADANGSATVTLELQDDGGTANGGVDTSAPQSFTVTVTAVNDAPSFSAGPDQTVNEDAGPQTVDPWATALSAGPADEASQTLGFTVSNDNNALFSVQPAVSATGVLSYTPAVNASGSATITLELRDNGGTADGGEDTSPPQNFNITVNAVDDAPVAVDDSATLSEDDPATAIDVLTNDTDIDGGPKVIASASDPTNGTVVLTGGAPGAHTGLTYQPDANYCNTPPGTTPDTFTYTLNGGDTGTVSVTVNCVDDAPLAVDDSATVSEDDPASTIDVLANDADIDGGPQSILSLTQPTNGTAVITGGGTGLTYQPDPDYCNNPPGSTLDTFTYTLTPGGSTAAVSMTVSCINDPPLLTLPGPDAVYDFATPVLIDPTAMLTDIDSPDFGTGTVQAQVTEATCDANDLLTVNDQGVGAGQISVVVDAIFFDDPAVQIGTITSDFLCDPNPPGAGNSLLTITLNANATVSVVQTLVQNLAFSSTGAAAPNRVVEITVNDGDGGTSAIASKAVTLDAAPGVQSISPADSATGVAINSDITITFSEDVTAPAAAFDITCTSSGNHSFALSGGPASFTLNPDTDFINGETCTVTVLAVQVSDIDAIDPPDNMAADFTASFTTVDIAPTVISTTPTAATTVANDQTVTLNFSENVNIASGGITWDCSGTVAFTPALPQNNVDSVTLTPSSALPEGASCTVTLESTLITDADDADPPNELDGDNSNDITDGDADDFTLGFTVDTPPSFVSSTPANNDTGVLLNSAIQITFDEAVEAEAADFGLNCGAGTPGFNISGSGTTIITLTPAANLPQGATCTVTLNTTLNDSDAIDPPDDYANNVPSFSFATVDLAPTVTNTQVEVAGVLTTTPTSNVDADTTIVVTFSETVNAASGAFTVDNCTISGDVSAQFSASATPASTVTLSNGGADLFPGETCTLTVVAANITDTDGIPPATMAANASTTFTIDAVLQITAVNVDTESTANQDATAAALTDVNPGTGIDTLFNEAADGSGSWFSIVCDSASVVFSPSAFDAQTSVTATPGLEPGESCTLTYASANLTDDDASDPPDNLDGDENGLAGGDKSVSFGVRPDAVADIYNSIHTNLGIIVPAGNGVLTNDDRGDASPATVVGWGTTAPAAQSNTVAAGAQGSTAQGGFATVNADGSFTYDPPPGFTGADTFFYHLSNANGDHVAQVTLNVAGTRIWFINDTSPGSANRGTLQNPFTSLASFNGSANTQAGDFVHIEHNSAAYAGGLTLKNLMTVIGEGATGTLPGFVASLGSISTFSPTLPTLGGTRPQVTNGSGNGVTLAATNTLRGFNVGNTSGSGISGSGAGTLTVSQCAIIGTGVGINVSNKTLVAAFSEISSSNNSGILLNSVTGDFDVTTGVINSGVNTAVSIVGGGANVDLGVTLVSVSANGAASGIVLTNTTATSGGFTVTGDGASDPAVTTSGRTTSASGGGTLTLGSGGTIVNTTDGILLTNAANVTLRNMVIGNAGRVFSDAVSGASSIIDNGMELTNVTGLTLDNVLISDTGDHGIQGFGANINLNLLHTEILNAGDNGAGATNGDDAMDFATGIGGPAGPHSLTGTANIDASILAGMSDTGLEVENFSGNLDLNVRNSFIGNNHHSDAACNPCEGDGFLLRADGGSATIDMLVEDSVFQNIANDGIDTGNDQGSNISTLIVQRTDGNTNNQADNLIDTANNIGTLRVRNTDIDSDGAHRGTVLFYKADGAATTDVTINTSVAAPSLISGTTVGNGIDAFIDGNPGTNVLANGSARLLIENTDVSNHFSAGVNLIVQDMASAAGTLDVTLDDVTTSKPTRTDAIVGSVEAIAGGGGNGTLQLNKIDSRIGLGSFAFAFQSEGLVLRGDRDIDISCNDDGNGGNGTPCTNIGSNTSDDALVASIMNENGNQVDDSGLRNFVASDVFTSSALENNAGTVLIIDPSAVTLPTLP